MSGQKQVAVTTPLLPRIGAVAGIGAGVTSLFLAWNTRQSNRLAEELGLPGSWLPWWTHLLAALFFLTFGVVEWRRRNTPPPGLQYGDDPDPPAAE